MSNFSFSRISLFEKCPKAYHFKYILKKDEYFSTIEQHLGKSIHTAIEYAYQIRDEGYNASINSFIDTFNESWGQTSINNYRIVKSSMSADAYYSEGVNILKNFFNNTFANDKSKTIALEKYFEISIAPSISYVGYIDRISIESNNFVRVPDLPNAFIDALQSKGIFFNWVSEDVRAKKAYDITTNSVTLSSIHSIKGLDYYCIFLVGLGIMEEKRWTEEQIERLTYVAVTRARNHLYIPYIETTPLIERMIDCL